MLYTQRYGKPQSINSGTDPKHFVAAGLPKIHSQYIVCAYKRGDCVFQPLGDWQVNTGGQFK